MIRFICFPSSSSAAAAAALGGSEVGVENEYETETERNCVISMLEFCYRAEEKNHKQEISRKKRSGRRLDGCLCYCCFSNNQSSRSVLTAERAALRVARRERGKFA